MHRAVLASGDGVNFRDSDGNALTAIGNVTYKAGDAVWTDGRCIYGWVRPNQQNELTFPQAGDVPWLSMTPGDIGRAWVLPIRQPRDYKRIGDYMEEPWVNDNPSFIVGEDRDAAFVVLKSTRKAKNIITGDAFTLATPALCADSDVKIADALVDDNGDLLVLETYRQSLGGLYDADKRYSGFAVHRNDSIIDDVAHIDGNVHLPTLETGEEWYHEWRVGDVLVLRCREIRRTETELSFAPLTALGVHLRNDGSYYGTMAENGRHNFLPDADEVEDEVQVFSLAGTIYISTNSGSFRDSYPAQVADITTETIYYKPLGETEFFEMTPFADVVPLLRTETFNGSAAMFYYDSDSGDKTEVLRKEKETVGTYYVPGLSAVGGYVLKRDYVMTGEDSGTTIPYTVKCTQAVVNYSTGYGLTAGDNCFTVLVEDENGGTICAAYVVVPISFPSMTSLGFWGTEASTETVTGQGFSYSVGGRTITVGTPTASTGGYYALGELYPYRLFPQSVSGDASCLGLTFHGRDLDIYDIKQIGVGRYLLLTSNGLYLSQDGTSTRIHPDFTAATGNAAYASHTNGRINKANIPAIKAGLDDMTS